MLGRTGGHSDVANLSWSAIYREHNDGNEGAGTSNMIMVGTEKKGHPTSCAEELSMTPCAVWLELVQTEIKRLETHLGIVFYQTTGVQSFSALLTL